MELNKVHNIDFLDNSLSDKCAKLIIADPPYFEVKGEFDFIWATMADYLKDVEAWAIACKRILKENGMLNFSDKSAPEVIYKEFQVSKKAFRRAVGLLYSDRKVIITPTTIELVKD